MRIIFSENAWEDYLYWQKTDKRILNRTSGLVKDIRRSPLEGVGKPEPLRHALAGFWSRRIDDEHRIVYKMESGALLIAGLRYHTKISKTIGWSNKPRGDKFRKSLPPVDGILFNLDLNQI